MGIRVVILGRDGMLLNLIRGTMLSGAEIVGVFRYETATCSKIKRVLCDWFKSSPEYTMIKKHKINDLNFASANSEKFRKFLIKNNVDVVLVGSWFEKISKKTFNIPTIGTINVHPSLLPKYRGPNPYLQTILHGEKKSGVTFHLMSEKFDSGAILAQKEIEILSGDTGKELKNKTIFQARLICADLLQKLEGGFVIPLEQDESQATYFSNVKPEDMTLNFEKENSEQILNRVRAFHPWLKTYIEHENKFYIVNPYKVVITEDTGEIGSIIKNTTTSISAVANDSKILKFDDVKEWKSLLKKSNCKNL